MKKGEQQKILHKGSNDKVNAFITLLYPINGIKFTTSKTRNSSDFINHLNSIKRYVLQRTIKRFILVIDNASFHVSNKTKQYYEKTVILANCTISTNTSSIPKYSRNKSKQKYEKRCMWQLQIRNRRESIMYCKKVS